VKRASAYVVGILAAAVVFAACGSSNDTTSTSTAATTSSPHAAANIVVHLPGTARRRATPQALGKLHNSTGARARLTGFAAYPLPQRLAAMAASVASVWSNDGVSAASVNVIGNTPVTCQTSQGPVHISAGDPPAYCQTDQTIELPVGYFDATLRPLGDAAMLLAVSDTYGYHVLGFVGELDPNAGLTPAQIAERSSCLSGIYFRTLSNQPGQVLNSADIDSVDKEMVVVTAPGTRAAANAVSAQDLTNAFNRGIFALFNPHKCL
jgi:hypothetical protein